MILESPTGQGQLEVDRTHSAARASRRPIDHIFSDQLYGHYRVSARSGLVTGTDVDDGSPLFSVRWADPDALLVLLLLEAFWTPTTAFSAAQELALSAVLASGFTVADSAGSAIALGVGQRARRSNMAPSRVADMRIAAATLLTAGTRTLDPASFAGGGGIANVVNAAAGTEYLNHGGTGPVAFGFRYAPERDEHPIVLGVNEGIVVRSENDFPAAGVAVLTVNLAWAEVRSY